MNKVKKKQPNLLNELMIVNPGTPENEESYGALHSLLDEDNTLYLGEDGTLHRLASFEEYPTLALSEAGFGHTFIGQYFLGEDGTVYEVLNV